MIKIFSTKLDVRVLKALDLFCQQYHVKKSRILEDLILEGIERKRKTFKLAQSIERGLEDETNGRLFSFNEVEKSFSKNKKSNAA